MTLVSSIITDAYRESNMLPLGAALPANKLAEALRLYNALITSIYGGLAGEQLNDWPLGTFNRDPNGNELILPYTPDQLANPALNRRLIATSLVAMTVWLDPNPQAGARMGIADPFGRLAAFPITINANGRTIEGNPTLLLNVNSTSRSWLYRSDLAAWMKITDLLSTDENPFPARFDNMFVILLAMRINPRYGRTLDPQSVATLKQNKQEFEAFYLQSANLDASDDLSWPFMSRQSYVSGRNYSSQRAFDRGSYFGR